VLNGTLCFTIEAVSRLCWAVRREIIVVVYVGAYQKSSVPAIFGSFAELRQAGISSVWADFHDI
jgi:hypothetical protein